jgi:ankyrin repeat protein
MAKVQDKKSVIPLHVACMAGASNDVVEMLLELNPDASIMVTMAGRDAIAFCNECNAANKLDISDMLFTYHRRVHQQARLASQPSSRRLIV